MKKVVISGSGVYTPSNSISNEELVAALNTYVAQYNQQHQAEITAGTLTALLPSDSDFIVKASGIKQRYAYNKEGILDQKIFCPKIPARADEELSVQAEVSIAAAKEAMARARKTPDQIDAVINTVTNTQRAYPGISIEVQNALGIKGFAFDMGVACSSVTFAIQAAYAAIISGQARCVLIINPEITTLQVDFTDRESHFIFGDVATALIIESAETCTAPHAFEILGIKLKTQFSNNIRCNFGYFNRAERAAGGIDKPNLFSQQGRKVFKEVIPWVENLITQHLAEFHIEPAQLKRLWLHQANINMNRLIATKILGYEPDEKLAPVILDKYANTASSGVAIVFHQFHEDLKTNDLALMCSFGAGYSAGNILLRKL